jgi:hypothetical protein
MNPLENNPPATSDSNEKIDGLRSQMNLMFGALLIASFTLTAFLAIQARRASLDLLSLRGPAAESMRLVQQDNQMVEATYAKLTDFARTHPDFQKVVFAKYRLSTNGAPAAATPAAPAKK